MSRERKLVQRLANDLFWSRLSKLITTRTDLVAEYDKARDHLEKALVIKKEVGDRNGEALCYLNLGTVYQLVGEYDKAREHIEKCLAMKKEMGDRDGEAGCYGNLGIVYRSVGEYDKAREHLEKSLAIKKEVCDKNGEARPTVTETLELCMDQLANITRRGNISRNHL